MTIRIGAAALLVVVLLAGCSATRQRAVPSRSAEARDQVLYVVRRGWHVDVGFRGDALGPALSAMLDDGDPSQVVLVGFGDRRYLLARHKSLDGIMAILHPGRALLLVSELEQSPRQAFPDGNVRELHVTAGQLAAAQSAVAASLSTTEPGAIAPGPYDRAVYFAAARRYSALHTCNTWAAEVLAAAGLPVRSSGTLFATQLWRQVERLD